MAIILLCLAFAGSAVAFVEDIFGWKSSLVEKLSPHPSMMQNKTLDPQSAPVPSLCKHPAGALVGGELKDSSGAGATRLAHNAYGAVLASQRDTLRRDEVASALALSCDVGGVGWPDTIALYSPLGDLLGFKTLDSLTHGPRESIQTIEFRGDAVRVSWTAAGEGDPDCCGSVVATADFTMESSALVASPVETTTEATDLAKLLIAISAKDVTSAQLYLSPEGVSKLLSISSSEGLLELGKCYGRNNSREIPIDIRKHLVNDERFSLSALGDINLPAQSTITRFCLVSSPAATRIFGLSREANTLWRVRLISEPAAG